MNVKEKDKLYKEKDEAYKKAVDLNKQKDENIKELEKTVIEKDKVIDENTKSLEDLRVEHEKQSIDLEKANKDIIMKEGEIKESTEKIKKNEQYVKERDEMIKQLQEKSDIMNKVVSTLEMYNKQMQEATMSTIQQQNNYIEQLRQAAALEIQRLLKSDADKSIYEIAFNNQFMNTQTLFGHLEKIRTVYPFDNEFNGLPENFKRIVREIIARNQNLQQMYLRQTQQTFIGGPQMGYLPGNQQYQALPYNQTENIIIPQGNVGFNPSNTRLLTSGGNIKVSEIIDENKPEERIELQTIDDKKEELIPTQPIESDEPEIEKKVEMKDISNVSSVVTDSTIQSDDKPNEKVDDKQLLVDKEKEKKEVKEDTQKINKKKVSTQKKDDTKPKKHSEPKTRKLKMTKEEPKKVIFKEKVMEKKEKKEEQPIEIKPSGNNPVKNEIIVDILEKAKKGVKRRLREDDELIKSKKILKEDGKLVEEELIIEEQSKQGDAIILKYSPKRVGDQKFIKIEKLDSELYEDSDLQFIIQHVEDFTEIYIKRERDVEKLRKIWIFEQLLNYIIEHYHLREEKTLNLPLYVAYILINYQDLIEKIKGISIKEKDMKYKIKKEDIIYKNDMDDFAVMNLINDTDFKLIVGNGIKQQIGLHLKNKNYIPRELWLFIRIVEMASKLINNRKIENFINDPLYIELPFIALFIKWQEEVIQVLKTKQVKDDDIKRLIFADKKELKVKVEKSKENLDRRIIFDHLDVINEGLNIQYLINEDKEFRYIIDDLVKFINEYMEFKENGKRSEHPIAIQIFEKVYDYIKDRATDIIINWQNYKNPRYLILIEILNGQRDYMYSTIFKTIFEEILKEIPFETLKEIIPDDVANKEKLKKGDEFTIFEIIVDELYYYSADIIENEKKKLNKK